MTEPQALAALFTALGIVGAASVTGVGVVLGILWRRIAHLEDQSRELWWWALTIKDLYYRNRKPGTPDLPPPPARKEPTT